MKKLLIGLLVVGNLSAYAAEKCSFYVGGDSVAKQRLTEALISLGYNEVSHESDARYYVSSSRRDEGGYFKASVIIHDLEMKKNVFSDEKNTSFVFYNINPVITKVKETFKKCK